MHISIKQLIVAWRMAKAGKYIRVARHKNRGYKLMCKMEERGLI
jgi:hypothetical protein